MKDKITKMGLAKHGLNTQKGNKIKISHFWLILGLGLTV